MYKGKWFFKETQVGPIFQLKKKKKVGPILMWTFIPPSYYPHEEKGLVLTWNYLGTPIYKGKKSTW